MLRQRRALLAVGPLGLRIQEEAGGAGDGGRSTRSGQGENAGKRFFPRLLPPLSSVGLLAGGGEGTGGGARWEQILAGLHSYCGCLGVLATGQVNRLGTLPPWRVRKEPGPGHCTTSASAGQEDDLGLSNGLATLPVPASHPAC